MKEYRSDSHAAERVVLREFNSVNEAEMLKSLLESAGIWSMINNEYMSAIYPFGAVSAQIVILKEDLERALALITI